MQKSNSVYKIKLPKIEDFRGNLTFLEENNQVPFKIERVFWTYDVPGGEKRGGHAYKTQEEIIIALSGSFDVVITETNGAQKTYPLNRSYNAIYIPPHTWRHIENHSTNALSLHLSSRKFDADDYIRNIKELK
jgi:oxalate decarboxylase/phosphoglucose isomerase-like protein (cupin superfamily)